MKNFMMGVGMVIFVLGLCFLAYQYGTRRSATTDKIARQPAPTPSGTQELVGGDRDTHGCIGSAGYSWCDTKQKCLRPFEEICDENAEKAQIKQALLSKHQWNGNDYTIIVKTLDPKYASGSVNGQGGGGLFFAAKSNGTWVIVADGNGIVECGELVDFPDYPSSLIPSCYVKATGQIVKR